MELNKIPLPTMPLHSNPLCVSSVSLLCMPNISQSANHLQSHPAEKITFYGAYVPLSYLPHFLFRFSKSVTERVRRLWFRHLCVEPENCFGVCLVSLSPESKGFPSSWSHKEFTFTSAKLKGSAAVQK